MEAGNDFSGDKELLKKSLFDLKKLNFATLFCRHSSDSDSGEDYGVSDDENDNPVVGNPVVIAVAPVVVAQQVHQLGPPAHPLLRPNGHQWREDGDWREDPWIHWLMPSTRTELLLW
jgi:hypothetical protein